MIGAFCCKRLKGLNSEPKIDGGDSKRDRERHTHTHTHTHRGRRIFSNCALRAHTRETKCNLAIIMITRTAALLAPLLCLVAFDAAQAVPVEELIVDSPSQIDELFKRSLKAFSKEVEEEEGSGRGERCSKDEHCEAHERCSKIGRCRPRDSKISDACRYGFITCAHEKDSPMRKRAENEADRRLGRPNAKTEEALRVAMLPQPNAKNMMALPAPGLATDGEDGSSLSGPVAAGEASGSDESMAVAMAAQVSAIQLVENVANGALAASGALPTQVEKWGPLAEKGKERVTRRPFYNYWDKEDRTWRLATEQLTAEIERNSTNYTASKLSRKAQKYPNLQDKSMLEWFEAKGGKLSFVSPSGLSKGDSRKRHLVAEEAISDGDTILEVPLKLVMNQITCSRVKTQRGRYLGELFGGAIAGNYSDWGLAGFLLVELKKGESSQWWPFIRTLRMHIMSTDILAEIEGTYTGKMLGEWEAESESASKYLDKVIDHKDPLGDIKSAWSLRKDMRWALWAVRRYAVWVYKPRTLKKILSLVPFAHLLKHNPRVEGV